jgi:YhcH/YjgK/YiaL family protein
MIIDTLKNIDLYKGLSDDIHTGLLFLQSTDSSIELGSYTINSRVMAIVEEYETIPKHSREFESHKHVIDIQFPIIGTERVFWSPIANMDIKIPYDKKNDRTIFVNPHVQSTHVDIGDDVFAIMFESDGHSPKHCVDFSQAIKKITIKVSVV